MRGPGTIPHTSASAPDAKETPLRSDPDPFVLGGQVAPLLNEIKVTLTDTGIEPAELALADAVYLFVITNDSATAHGFFVGAQNDYDEIRPEGDPIAPGEPRIEKIQIESSSIDRGENIGIYDPSTGDEPLMTIELLDRE